MNLTLTLGVVDLDQTADFYRDILHLPIERFLPGAGHQPLLMLRRGDATILFRQLETLEAQHPALFQSLHRHPLGIGMTLEFIAADLKPVLRAIDRQQLHLLYELEDDEFDRHEIWLHDPNGYLVILCQERPD
ncbi:VOC family protein [Trichloromonas sp.]|uniref:VOC family protein n=1 Tax=Trichloromonas sp. TaxID=3069249 RepID=UPI003D8131C6